ncbi:MAG: MoxR-like ATPase [Chloroflexota bacterium]|jgi:MoxR-like ATPase|nr:MoxR-like ATPase [Chloroflexota bacterium]
MAVSTASASRSTSRGAAAKASGRKPLTSEQFQERFETIVGNIEQVIKGKGRPIRMVITAILAEGHVLLEDLPGTGKTMLARSIAQTIQAENARIQCTPDLLPSDITGSSVVDMATREFKFRAGPVFTNILLADEINRATPKTQSSLLEAMQERRVSVDGITHNLPKPFLLLATQNPIELAGTFPLPEAQLDRFLFKISLGYPDSDAEMEILEANSQNEAIDRLKPACSLDDVLDLQDWPKGVEVAEPVRRYIVEICQATRTDPSLQLPASPRASLALMRASRVVAAANGREDVIPDDVKSVLHPVLAHRIALTPDAELRDDTIDKVIERITSRVKPPLGVGQAA